MMYLFSMFAPFRGVYGKMANKDGRVKMRGGEGQEMKKGLAFLPGP